MWRRPASFVAAVVVIFFVISAHIFIFLCDVAWKIQKRHPARGRVTDCGVKGLWFISSILTSWTETSFLSWVVRDGGDACSLQLIGWKKSLLRWCLRHGRWTATTVQKTTPKQKQNSFLPYSVQKPDNNCLLHEFLNSSLLLEWWYCDILLFIILNSLL